MINSALPLCFNIIQLIVLVSRLTALRFHCRSSQNSSDLCALPAQHQTAGKVSNYLMNIVEQLAAKETNIFSQELVETKTELKGE